MISFLLVAVEERRISDCTLLLKLSSRAQTWTPCLCARSTYSLDAKDVKVESNLIGEESDEIIEEAVDNFDDEEYEDEIDSYEDDEESEEEFEEDDFDDIEDIEEGDEE